MRSALQASTSGRAASQSSCRAGVVLRPAAQARLPPLCSFLPPRSVVTTRENRDPDIEDPEWPTKVTDWREFWFDTEWEAAADDEELDDEQDAQLTATPAIDRARAMIDQIKSLSKREDVIHILALPIQKDRTAEDMIEQGHPEGVRPDPNPYTSLSDLRALAEKRAKARRLDEEWRHRQSLRTKFSGRDVYNDVRAQEFYTVYPDNRVVSDEEVLQLITQGGRNCHPDRHGGIVENPLATSEYHGTHGVEGIEDTEAFLARIGRWVEAAPEEETELELDEADFEDWLAATDPVEHAPELNVYRDAGGTATYGWFRNPKEDPEVVAAKRRGRKKAAPKSPEPLDALAEGAGDLESGYLEEDDLVGGAAGAARSPEPRRGRDADALGDDDDFVFE